MKRKNPVGYKGIICTNIYEMVTVIFFQTIRFNCIFQRMTVEVLNMIPFLTVDSTLCLLLALICSIDALIKAPAIATMGMKPLFQVTFF